MSSKHPLSEIGILFKDALFKLINQQYAHGSKNFHFNITKMSNPLKIVDISQDDQALVQKQLLDAATTQGFLFIEGHDFTQQEVDSLFELSNEFFKLPHEYKQKFPIDASNHGYSDFAGENLDPKNQKKGDPKEALNFCALNFKTGDSSKPIPDWFTNDSSREELLRGVIVRLYKLSIRILEILAQGLEIEDTDGLKGKDWFSAKYAPDKSSGSTFRLLHYPGQKSLNPESVVRAGAHTDYGAVTLLFQRENQAGLEIYSPVSKQWESVPFVPSNDAGVAPPIVVNIGDLLSYWTAGLLKSTIHRVKFPKEVQETGQDRYSIVFFSHPNDDALLEPVPCSVIRNREGRGANNAEVKITAREHLQRRLAATYGW
ncbi:uncharacterized protein SPAPADRAFT_58740 [Spathaspora passalidarum NRRL Y-27907]|uniref:Fe2OG dioxygenase domain-containing protein n=1 Tax=Spathaspora passalidarum (strain NRRL Y-27907 / 11-Y1) TaxID=619300 RepID=G3AH70_SPAPN|nr:uncharacterized protein SPAPADRAFT_58740 [Spathaspora passalidarum NRRL Y-27907]EGW35501.1 hypothetical protein SPAPADRAFT_58740 [Spathaspora passalidarum NRRL Y-27907]